MVGDDHLVARIQLEAVGHEVHGLGRVPRKHEPLRVGIQKRAHGTLEVVPLDARRIGGSHSARVFGNSLHHHSGRGSQCAVVQVDAVAGNEELATDEVPELLVSGSSTHLEVSPEGGNRAGPRQGRGPGCLKKAPSSNRHRPIMFTPPNERKHVGDGWRPPRPDS